MKHETFEGFRKRLTEAHAALFRRETALAELGAAREVAVYSYGSKGRELAGALRHRGVECLIFDNGAASRDRARAAGFQVVERIDDRLPLVVAAGQNQIEILRSLPRPAFNLGEAHFAFDLPAPYGSAREVAAVAGKEAEALFETYRWLDAASAAAFMDVLEYRASMDVHRLKGRRPVGDMWRPPVDGLEIESFCDIGAYDGDSLRAIKAVYPALRRSFTIEPNPALEAAVSQAAAELGIDNRHFIGAAWNRASRLDARELPSAMFVIEESPAGAIAAQPLDSLLAGETFDYFKMDVEGTERQVIAGGEKAIGSAICVAVAGYHLPRDLIDLPRQLAGLLGGFEETGASGWRLAFAHYSQVFDDSIFYAWRRRPAVWPVESP
jgi:FkbM family methyltransferase